MGSKPGAVVALSELVLRGWDVRHVVVSRKVTHPWSEGPTLEEAALEAGLSTVTQSELPLDQPVDFVLSYMFRYRVTADVLALARTAALNFHAAPLPEYGGWAFYNVAILEDAREYGCTCHHMDEGFDTGPIVEVRRFPVDATAETACSLERRAQQEMIRLFIDVCDRAESGADLPRLEQDVTRARYMTREEFDGLKRIPDGADAATIDRVARAFWYPPYQCAYTEIGGTRVEVVPEIAKAPLAALLHESDLSDLQQVAAAHRAGARG